MRECKRKKNALLSKVSDIHSIWGLKGGAAFVCSETSPTVHSCTYHNKY